MDRLEDDLAAFYDQEAAIRLERDIDPPRVERRGEFIEMLRQEARGRLLEVGTGPGHDARAFLAAGLDVAGVDLSIEHVRMARDAGVDAFRASLFDLPFADRSFEAGWTMSTLLHVADDRFEAAMTSICSKLRVGAPLAVGLWGGLDRESLADFDTIQPPRFFSLRSHDRARSMLSVHGEIERFETWPHQGDTPWEYQFVVLRVRARPDA